MCSCGNIRKAGKADNSHDHSLRCSSWTCTQSGWRVGGPLPTWETRVKEVWQSQIAWTWLWKASLHRRGGANKNPTPESQSQECDCKHRVPKDEQKVHGETPSPGRITPKLTPAVLALAFGDSEWQGDLPFRLNEAAVQYTYLLTQFAAKACHFYTSTYII